MKRLDVIIIAGVIVIAAALYFSGILRPGGKGAKAIVTVDGNIFGEYDLLEDRVVEVDIPEVGRNIFKIENGKVDMTQADCRDHICVDHEAIYRNGETIICLPHKLIIEIEGGDKAAVDSALN